jgi:Peptidase A4 family
MPERRRHPERLGRYRNYDLPPAGFDPHTASDAALLRHGLPRRPDPHREPDLARIWNRLFARPLTYLKAELVVDKVRSGRNPLLAKDPKSKALQFAVSNWAGAIVTSDPPFKWVFAEFVIPEVLGTKKHFWNPDVAISFWGGIDGLSYIMPPDQVQVLQAGVVANLTTSWRWGWPHSAIGWWAWTEWWHPNDQGSVAIANFPVQPGQTVSFVVCAPQPGDTATIFVANATTGHGTSILIDPPAGITSQGTSAEWIVEAPNNGNFLLQFDPVTFSDCRAGKPDGISDLTNAFEENIVIMGGSGNDKTLTDVEIGQPNSVAVNWISSD